MSDIDVREQIALVKEWFGSREITDAVVGYSGGVDSTATILLLSAADIKVHLVVAEAPNQKYSSPMGGREGATALGIHYCSGSTSIHHYLFTYPFPIDGMMEYRAANEAALPILRNAIFYGLAAKIRYEGYKVVVAGTANFSEAAFLGFWGKASDGAQDVYPISHLSKNQVYSLAAQLGAPKAILYADPSGDLLFENNNDFNMIGATYEEIEKVIEEAERVDGFNRMTVTAMHLVSDHHKFADNIVRNSFKYELPFPGFHLSNRLEVFRQYFYPNILAAAKNIIE